MVWEGAGVTHRKGEICTEILLLHCGCFVRRFLATEERSSREERRVGGSRESDARLTLGNRRHAGKEETHKICGTDERWTRGSACGFGGRTGSGD